VSETPTFHALGYSETRFDPFKPGRLCRGRERWIQPWPREEDAEQSEPSPMMRLVITGAEFKDDSARDALRGLQAAGVTLADLLRSLFPNNRMVVFTEDGHPADIPDGAQGIELYPGYRAGGRSSQPKVRWYKDIEDKTELDLHVLFDGQDERCRGVAIVDKDVDLDVLWEKIYPLVGLSTLDSPPAHYQPAALPDLLNLAACVVILHRDKHGTALGIYANDALGLEDRIADFADETGCLLVPFAIPPMLARWDRALGELRQVWEREREEPFPVPVGENGGWEGRRGRRRRKDKSEAPSAELPGSAAGEDHTSAPSEDAPVQTAEEVEAPANEPEAPSEAVDTDDLDALLSIGDTE